MDKINQLSKSINSIKEFFYDNGLTNPDIKREISDIENCVSAIEEDLTQNQEAVTLLQQIRKQVVKANIQSLKNGQRCIGCGAKAFTEEYDQPIIEGGKIIKGSIKYNHKPDCWLKNILILTNRMNAYKILENHRW